MDFPQHILYYFDVFYNIEFFRYVLYVCMYEPEDIVLSLVIKKTTTKLVKQKTCSCWVFLAI